MELINTLRPRQSGHHFADSIFKCIFLNENVYSFFQISLKVVPMDPINNKPELVQIMARCQATIWFSNDIVYPASLRPEQNGQHDDIFKGIFVDENLGILIQISSSVAINGFDCRLIQQ